MYAKKNKSNTSQKLSIMNDTWSSFTSKMFWDVSFLPKFSGFSFSFVVYCIQLMFALREFPSSICRQIRRPYCFLYFPFSPLYISCFEGFLVILLVNFLPFLFPIKRHSNDVFRIIYCFWIMNYELCFSCHKIKEKRSLKSAYLL